MSGNAACNVVLVCPEHLIVRCGVSVQKLTAVMAFARQNRGGREGFRPAGCGDDVDAGNAVECVGGCEIRAEDLGAQQRHGKLLATDVFDAIFIRENDLEKGGVQLECSDFEHDLERRIAKLVSERVRNVSHHCNLAPGGALRRRVRDDDRGMQRAAARRARQTCE